MSEMAMTPEQFQLVSSVFLAARKLAGANRAAFLDESCHDAAVRLEVERMLAAEENTVAPLQTVAMSSAIRDAASDALDELTNAQPSDDAGDDGLMMPSQVGPYRIVRLIGRGGMGTVFEAEQDVPRRRVAIKMIRPGLVSPGVLKRFRQEVEVLGRLHHPGIAQVFDAGMFDQGDGGQPFFAMEFIGGLPIVGHAAKFNLSIDNRLELMAKVADAVEHAHRAGVIHRDLKPGNILVDQSDDEPQPKILDFGVARAVDPDARLTTIQTNMGQLIGTLGYMSPEQARGDSARIDARTDVYALGVIGYELLAGRLPLEVGGRAIQEAMRIVIEDEPSSLGTVNRSLRGDVDTIIATALAKEPARRYPSAAAFAADIRRFLHNEPIVARPASTVYQLRKFARRNRGLVAGVATAFALLIVAVIGTSVGMVRAREEARRAQRMNEFLSGMIAWFEPAESPGGFVTLDQVLSEAQRRIASELSDDPAVASALQNSIGQGFTSLAKFAEAEAILRESLESRRRIFGPRSAEAAETLNHLGVLLRRSGRAKDAEPLLRESLTIRIERLGEKDDDVAETMNNLAAAVAGQGRISEAESLLKESLLIHERAIGGEDEALATGLSNLAAVMIAMGRNEEAEPHLRRSINIRRRLGGRALADLPVSLGQLAMIATHGRNNTDEAIDLLTEAVRIRRDFFGLDHQMTCDDTANLAFLHYGRGEYEQTAALYDSWFEHCDNAAKASAQLLHHRVSFGHALIELGRMSDAEPILRSAVEMNEADAGIANAALGLLATCLWRLDRTADAREYFERVSVERISRRIIAGTLIATTAMRFYESEGLVEKAERWRAALSRLIE